jgi:hypothetical protein
VNSFASLPFPLPTPRAMRTWRKVRQFEHEDKFKNKFKNKTETENKTEIYLYDPREREIGSSVSTERLISCFKLASYAIPIVVVFGLDNSINELDFQAERFGMARSAHYFDGWIALFLNVLYFLWAARWQLFWRLSPVAARLYRSPTLIFQLCLINYLFIGMRYPSWTGLSDRVVLCLQLASGYVRNMTEVIDRFRFRQKVAMSHHTSTRTHENKNDNAGGVIRTFLRSYVKPLRVVATRLLMPLVFGHLLRMPVWFLFSTRLPNVGLAWWDYHHVSSSFGYRDLSLTDKLQTEKETKQRTYVFRLWCLCTLIWVIVMGFMFWIEADERESYRTGPPPRYREGLLTFLMTAVFTVMKITRACYGTIYRFHNRIRCELEAERHWLETMPLETHSQRKSMHPVYSQVDSRRERNYQLFGYVAVIVCCVGIVFRCIDTTSL